MHKKYSAQDDVASQSYQGPSAIKAAAGEGVVAHFQWAAIGLVGGGVLAFFLHKPLAKPLEAARSWASNVKQSDNAFVRAPGAIVHFMLGQGEKYRLAAKDIHHIETNRKHGFGLTIFNETIGKAPFIKSRMEKALGGTHGKELADRIGMAFSAGGILGFFGYFVLPLVLSVRGAQRGVEGKQQFERAKDEIWDLRAENESLRARNIDLKKELNECSTDQAAGIRMAPDQPPIVREGSEGGSSPNEHPSDLKETPTTIEKPTVEKPTIESPTVTDPLTGKTTKVDHIEQASAVPTPSTKVAHIEAAPESKAKAEHPKADLDWAKGVQHDKAAAAAAEAVRA